MLIFISIILSSLSLILLLDTSSPRMSRDISYHFKLLPFLSLRLSLKFDPNLLNSGSKKYTRSENKQQKETGVCKVDFGL